MNRLPWIRVLIACAACAVLAALALAHVRFYAASSRLPATGTASEQLPGLLEDVEILLDGHGVPHVRAGTDHDTWFALGYVHARDRFFQMDLARRKAEGRLAELFGEAAVAMDRKARTWRLADTARRQAAQLTDDERRLLEAYSEGVNAALDRFGRWIAPEEWLLMLDPEPWQPEDSLAIGTLLQLELTWAMGEELQRAVQLSALGRDTCVDLWGWSPEQVQAWLPPTEATTFPLRPEDAITPPFSGVGSNNWVIAGSRTATGRPLLANDPHVGVQVPGIWYVVHLAGPEFHVAGASVPGVPGVAIGHNERVAWGFTMSMLDDQDLFRITIDPSGTHELVDGSWLPLRTATERIKVRSWDEELEHKVLLSERGPIVRHSNVETLALSWNGLFGPTPLRAFIGLNRATNVGDAAAAWRDVTSPSMNLVLADVKGQILHQVVGKVPDRVRGGGKLPAPGEHARWAWRGFLPLATNPNRLNPRQGFLATANHDLFGEGDYPERLRFSGEFMPAWRIDRIRKELASRDDWDIARCLHLQADIRSSQALAILQVLEHNHDLSRHDGATARALLQWDGTMAHDAVEPHLYTLLVEELGRAIGGDEAASHGLAQTPLGAEEILRLLGGGMDESWWDDLQTAEVEDRATIVARVLDRLDQRRITTTWGEVHSLTFAHPMGQFPLIGRFLDRFWSRGPLPAPGDGSTVNAHHSSHQRPHQVVVMPTLRLVADVGAWDNTVLVLPLGNSGRPWSPHYDDQLRAWRSHEPLTLAFSDEAVDRAARARLHLGPLQRAQQVLPESE